MYVNKTGIVNNGKVNTISGKLKIVMKTSRITIDNTINIINTDNTSDASVKIAPLNKNSCNLDKYFSGTILSIINAMLFTILNFIN